MDDLVHSGEDGAVVGLCGCVGVEIGSYDNQVVLTPPPGLLRYNAPGQAVRETVAVDSCLAREVELLWSRGIETTGCCCGHNKARPFIGVAFSDIPAMKELGYRVQKNPSRPGDEDSFWPMSIPVVTPSQPGTKPEGLSEPNNPNPEQGE